MPLRAKCRAFQQTKPGYPEAIGMHQSGSGVKASAGPRFSALSMHGQCAGSQVASAQCIHPRRAYTHGGDAACHRPHGLAVARLQVPLPHHCNQHRRLHPSRIHWFTAASPSAEYMAHCRKADVSTRLSGLTRSACARHRQGRQIHPGSLALPPYRKFPMCPPHGRNKALPKATHAASLSFATSAMAPDA